MLQDGCLEHLTGPAGVGETWKHWCEESEPIKSKLSIYSKGHQPSLRQRLDQVHSMVGALFFTLTAIATCRGRLHWVTGLNKRHFFLMVLGLEVQTKCLLIHFLVRACFLACRWPPSDCLFHHPPSPSPPFSIICLLHHPPSPSPPFSITCLLHHPPSPVTPFLHHLPSLSSPFPCHPLLHHPPGESLFPGLPTATVSSCLHMHIFTRGSSGVSSSYKGTNLTMRPTLMTSSTISLQHRAST